MGKYQRTSPLLENVLLHIVPCSHAEASQTEIIAVTRNSRTFQTFLMRQRPLIDRHACLPTEKVRDGTAAAAGWINAVLLRGGPFSCVCNLSIETWTDNSGTFTSN